ncbi:MAG: hypothetical protein RLZ92_1857 [Pseudomonadota bacterium]|jgi:AraC-like DNA-binding protein
MLTPEQKRQALAHRAAGWTLSSIAEKVGASVSSLKRLFDEHSVRRGSISEELVESAKNELILSGDLKQEIFSMIRDDLSLIRKTRTAISLTLDRIINDSETPPMVQARSLAALSTALGLNQAAYRKALQVSKHENSIDSEQLPELRVHYMTSEEQAAIASAVNSDAFGLCEVGADDDDVIEEEFA